MTYIQQCLPAPEGTPGVHRTKFKCTVNTLLRLLQLWCTDRPWLVGSIFDVDGWTGSYTFVRVQLM